MNVLLFELTDQDVMRKACVAVCNGIGNDVLQIRTADNHQIGVCIIAALCGSGVGKRGDTSVLVNAEHVGVLTEQRILYVDLFGNQRNIRLGANVLLDNGREVDVHNHVAIAEHDVVGAAAVDKVGRAHQCFKSALVELACGVVLVSGNVWGQELDAARTACQIPVLARADVVHQRLVIVVRNDTNGCDVGVDHVGKRKIDQAVAATKGDACRGAATRHFGKALLLLVRKNQTCNSHCSLPPFSFRRAWRRGQQPHLLQC